MTGTTLRIVLAASLWAISSPALAQRAQGEPGCLALTQPDRLQGLTPEGDLILASGRLAKLSGIRLPDEPPHRDMALSWLRARIDRSLRVEASSGTPDRWNRVSVRIRPSEEPAAPDWSRTLVEAGLAIVDPGIDEVFCQPELLPLEAFARERRLGVWADDRYKPLDVSQPERLRDRAGQFRAGRRSHQKHRRAHATHLFELRGALGRRLHDHHSSEDLETDVGSRHGRRGAQGTADQGPRHFAALARDGFLHCHTGNDRAS